MKIRIALVVCAALVLGALGAFLTLKPSEGDAGQVRTEGQALIGGPFQLIDHTGRTVTDADFRGKFMLVLFGYTYCPDICPTELQVMTSAMNALGEKASRVAPVFITIDPERDTEQQLASYVKSFHSQLVGLTGSPAAAAAAAKAYRVYASKVKDASSAADYLMDHSAFIYLMGPDGRYVTHFNYGVTPEKMAEVLNLHLNSIL
ncbi:MAG: SCO family protein [Hyphomicrobiales bacterium]|nr:SCO family protein [Hyphomicrobiales bacterium]